MAHQAGTVLLTQNFWYAIFPDDDQWGLYVRSTIAEDASKLVEKNLKESDASSLASPEHKPPEQKKIAPWHLIPAPLFLMIIFGISTSEKGRYLVESGRFDSLRINENGEWWRLATPLFLHADTTHLLGNILGGLLFGWLLASRVGTTSTYLIALLSGIAGNSLNLLTFQNTPHFSIGASTSVFGLLGALTGLRLREILQIETHTPHIPITLRHSRRIRYGVLGIGLFMLAWMGTGGGRTDVLAHLYGFISGFLLVLYPVVKILRNLFVTLRG